MDFINEIRKKTLAYNESMGKLNECKSKIKKNLTMLHEKCSTSLDEKQLTEMLSDLDEICNKHLQEGIVGSQDDFNKEFDILKTKFEQKLISENPDLKDNPKSLLIKVILEFKLKRSGMNKFFIESNKDYYEAFQKYITSLESDYKNMKSIKESVDPQVAVKNIMKQLMSGGINSAWAYFGMNSPLADGYRKPMSKQEIDQMKKESPEYLNIQSEKGYDAKLMVKASGSKYRKGLRISISLNSLDLYDIVFTVVNGSKFKVVAQEEDVYADTLFDVIKKNVG